MSIIYTSNNNSFGFIHEGWFSDRLYIFEDGEETNSHDEKIKLQEFTSELYGAGIASYGRIIGFFMSCLSLASAVRIGEETFYINNKSFCHYVLRKAAHKGTTRDDIEAMHNCYVNGIEAHGNGNATIAKVNACFLRQINNSKVPLEPWEIITNCVDDIILPTEIDTFTKQFLRPYITNQVDPNSPEEFNRAPMIDTLMTHLEMRFSIKGQGKCEEIALNSYIKHATHGLFQNYHISAGNRDMKKLQGFKIFADELSSYLQENLKTDEEYQELSQWYLEWNKTESPKLPTKEFLILLYALVPALEKDFPDYPLTCDELIEKVTYAFNLLAKEQKLDPIAREEKKRESDYRAKQDEKGIKIIENRMGYIKNYLGERDYEAYVEEFPN